MTILTDALKRLHKTKKKVKLTAQHGTNRTDMVDTGWFYKAKAEALENVKKWNSNFVLAQ